MADPIADHNAEEIAKLQRWRMRVSLIYYASVAEIPITFLCPCILTGIINMNNLGLNYAAVAMLCAIVLPLIGLAGALLMRFDFKRSWRCLELAQLANELGLRYTHKPDPDDFAFMAEFRFINLQRVQEAGTGENLLEGTFKKRKLKVLDYSYNHVYGNRVHNTQQTIAVFAGFKALPDFVIVKQWLGESFEQLIAGTPFGKKFKVPDEDDFNQQYTLAGADRKAVLACLRPEVIDILMEVRDLTILVQDGSLLVARQNVLVSEAEYQDFLLIAGELAHALTPRS